MTQIPAAALRLPHAGRHVQIDSSTGFHASGILRAVTPHMPGRVVVRLDTGDGTPDQTLNLLATTPVTIHGMGPIRKQHP